MEQRTLNGPHTREIEEKVLQLNTVDKFILLLAGAQKGEPIPGRIHLQKEMYFLQRRFQDLGDEAGYEPYLIGPYSEMVKDEAEQLELSGLISEERGRFEITRDGRAAFDSISRTMGSELEGVEEIKELLNDMTKREVMALVYFSEPIKGLENESVEYEDLARRREDLAMSMYKKDKIGAQKAAHIAGMYLGDFIDKIKTSKNL